MNCIKNRHSTAWLSIFTSLLALISTIFLNHEWLLDFVEEGHFIENLTLGFYLLAIFFVIFYKIGKIKLTSRFAIAFILFAMLAREADLHKMFGMSMLKIKFWLTDAAPIHSKLLAAVILLCILSAIFYLIINNYKNWYFDLKQKQPYAISIFTFFVVLVISKILDRSLGMIREMTGWVAPRWLEALLQPQEEYLECILPIIIMIAVFQYIDHKSQLK